MVFSSAIFLFAFLPLTLLAYFAASTTHRNFVLLVCSLAFYYWGEAGFVLLMVASAVVNYVFGRLVERASNDGSRRIWLFIAVVANLLPLLFFKYAVFLALAVREWTGSAVFSEILPNDIHLPIGISFFTFQSISYVVDVYRRKVKAQSNLIDLSLYIALFPQLIAGPIVRYEHIESKLKDRPVFVDDLHAGVQRFLIGLGKKVLIANVMGQVADLIFDRPVGDLSPQIALIGIIAYSLQIYYDFSGYSDMAIGLGRIFGFRFPENFNYPYTARSVTEFWRRWHMTLSLWFKDYVYVPLGGNRRGAVRTYVNLMIVFVLCGFWHGAQWTFLIWGLFHGAFLVFERMGIGSVIDKAPEFVGRIYTLAIVCIAWVFFRANDLDHALGYLQALVSFDRIGHTDALVVSSLTPEFWLTLIVGVVFSAPLLQWVEHRIGPPTTNTFAAGVLGVARELVVVVFLSAITLYSIASLLSSNHNPFLYFRF